MTIQTLQTQLGAALIERDREIRACTLAAIAGEHVLFVGPPGTAKSMLATSFAAGLSDARAFQILLTKFSTPEELFGPVSISALRADRYERKTDGYAPSAHVLFLDEVFKASSAILNTTLTLLQERAYDNGGVRIPCPLRLAIAASNEWPNTDEAQELGAVFDRFLIRRRVQPVSPAARDRLMYDPVPPVTPCLTLTDLDAARGIAAEIAVSTAARAALAQIIDELSGAGIRPGDRRLRKSVAIARAAAALDGAPNVQPAHLEDLQDVLWVDPEQADRAAEIIVRVANPTGARITEILRAVDETTRTAGADAAARMAAIKKLEESEREIAKLAPSGNGRAKTAAKYVAGERMRLQAAALGIDPAKLAAMMGSAA
jgi:MoxR-like ATPase